VRLVRPDDELDVDVALVASFCTRSTVCWNSTLRSSSPWMKRTGDFQVLTAATGDDSKAFLVSSADMP